MPRAAKEVKHHPSSVNDLLVQQLIRRRPKSGLVSFLSKEFTSIDKSLARRLVAELVRHSAPRAC